MKRNIFFSLSLYALIMSAFFVMATKPAWQPPITTAGISGDGTHEDPLDVVHGVLASIVITQASTSAPTGLVLQNIIDGDSDLAFTRDSAGVYKIECDNDEAFADSTQTYIATIGSATGVTAHFWRQSDSTLILQVYNASGTLADLVGKAYIHIHGPAPED